MALPSMVRSIVRLIPWLASCVAAGSALGSAAWAQPVSPSVPSAAGPPAITLAAAVESAWQRAVLSQEAEGRRRRALAGQAAAASPWAAPPALELSHRDDRWQSAAGRRETEVGVAWPLWLPGQRAARGAAADADTELASLAERAARLRLAGEVREAAWAVVLQQAEALQAQAQQEALQGLADDVERRVRAGDLARADALAARAELLAATAQQSQARQHLLAARAHWTLLTGLDAMPDPHEAVSADATPAAGHPELLLASREVERARRHAELTRASRREPPELALSYRQDTPGTGEAAHKSVAVALRLPFGTDDRNLPLQAAAETAVDLAQATERQVHQRHAAELAAARSALLSAEQQLASERTRAGLLRERAQLIDKSFRSGETPLPDLLRALAAASQADSAFTRQQAALGLARARLQQTLGLLP
jgi:cobalt-zinc-cadmium efflux system outer membrane protein